MPRLIGARIRSMRERRGMTQAELAHRTGFLEPAHVCRLENGRFHLASVDTIARIARALGVAPAAIVSAIDHVRFPEVAS